MTIYDQPSVVRYAIWAPSVNYRSQSDAPSPRDARWTADINRAQTYDTMFAVIGALVRGEADNMYGVEIRRLRPVAPRPAYVDEGRVE